MRLEGLSTATEKRWVMDKEKCYRIIDKCKEEISEIVKECSGKDANSAFLARYLIKDMDRLKKCISIDK